MKFDIIELNDSALTKRLKSYQFKLSLDILGKRISLNLSRSEAAKLTGLTENEYIEIEQGIDLKSSKEKYQSVLAKLNSQSNNLFAKHPEIDLRKNINSLDMRDNGKLVGKENVWTN